MPVHITLSDLTHTGQLVSSNTFPLGAAMVAAYTKKVLGDAVSVEIFRYPQDFSAHLEQRIPKIAGFSVFAWNNRLSYQYARRLKARSPGTIVVFGGVNVPSDAQDQKEYLERFPDVDFIIDGEGELAFVELYQALERCDFDVARLKRERPQIPNTRYLVDGEMVAGTMLPRIDDLTIVPSTFENGLSDKFFDDHLIPMIQSTRGCPYACTFCHEGALYYNKTKRVNWERIQFELDYIAKRVKVPDFIITDLNFGMFEEDIRTSQYMADLKKQYDWPKFVIIATAKNHKERVLDISKILGGQLPPGAAVQSTDPEVLAVIKRKNLPLDAVRAVARTAETDGAVSFSEVILCLPGDSKRAHMKSIFDVIDKGFSLIRTYQFLMLAGTEAAGRFSRRLHKLQTRFRVKPMNFGKYTLWGEEFSEAEIEEICVASATMSYDDYKDCRDLSLTVETFNNNGLFFDLFQFVERQGVPRAPLVKAIYDNVRRGEGPVGTLYRNFRKEEDRNLWTDEKALAEFVERPGVIDRYLDGEYGTNEIYRYRAVAVFENMEHLHDVAFAAARQVLAEHGKLSPEVTSYLGELYRFSLMRKRSFLDTELRLTDGFTFDFVELAQRNFAADPFEHRAPEGLRITLFHADWQRELIDGYKRQFGTSLVGVGRILNRAHIAQMYRTPCAVGSGDRKRVTTEELLLN